MTGAAVSFDEYELRVAGCEFCDEIADAQVLRHVSHPVWSGSRICWQIGPDLIVVPSLGALAVGHLLLLPRQHFRSMSQVALSLNVDVPSIAEAMRAAVTTSFGNTVMFEHGSSAEGSSGGCGISHAHLHVVPCGWDDEPPSEELGLSWDALPAEGWCTNPGVSSEQQADYLFFSPRAGRAFRTKVCSIPSQWMRRQIASRLGQASWNWREVANIEHVIATLAWL